MRIGVNQGCRLAKLRVPTLPWVNPLAFKVREPDHKEGIANSFELLSVCYQRFRVPGLLVGAFMRIGVNCRRFSGH